MNENELLEYQKMLDMINAYNSKNLRTDASEEDFVFAADLPNEDSEGPIPFPTPALPSENEPAAPGEGPVPAPTPMLPARPNVSVRPVLPPWSDIRPAGNCMGACLPFAYPSVEVKKADEGNACIIYELFAGKVSVLSSFLTCIYDGAYFYDERENVADVFRRVALCKQNHLNMLALLLTKLGARPEYHGCSRGRYSWWNSETDINYSTYLKMALLDVIEMETKLIENLNVGAAEVRDPYISTLLRRIVMDDRRHLEIFTDIYTRCCK